MTHHHLQAHLTLARFTPAGTIPGESRIYGPGPQWAMSRACDPAGVLWVRALVGGMVEVIAEGDDDMQIRVQCSWHDVLATVRRVEDAWMVLAAVRN